MKVDGGLGFGGSTDGVGAQAKAQEEAGYDGIWTAETSHDPFFPLLLAAEHTDTIQLGTGIAVAFARSPMTTAMTANDLQLASKGRFLLGLGSQIKPHIEKRFSMPWSHPAPRMREFVLAMRAIWDTWNNGSKLEFSGEFYRHTLMTPFFNPGPNPYGPPKVFLAAVGEKMTEVCGEVCDGMLVHGFTTERYIREVTLPALERGMKAGGRSSTDFELSIPAFVVTGGNDEEMAKADTAVRAQIAFYGSTPAYATVFELHGWDDLHPKLNAMSKQGQWKEMGEAIPDDVLDAFAVVAAPDQVAEGLRGRYGDVLDRLSFYAPYAGDKEVWAGVVADLKKP
ncbi:MAG: LLM class F420-dependent oxidoreductase [Actinobacteria bacterium]|nr:LLM class F420-dependent oxidoreductase [Actinomycetota bacterium]